MIINQIDIVSVKTTRVEDEAFSLELAWELNGSSGGNYTGDYTVVLYENGGKKDSETYTDTMGIQMATLTFHEMSYGKQYAVALELPKEQGGAFSSPADVVIDSFTGISGCYNGEYLELRWKMTSAFALQGICQIGYSTGGTEYHIVSPSNGYARLRPLPPAPGSFVQVSFWGKVGDVSEGPESDSVRFDASGITICTADIAKTENGAQLSCGFRSVYTDLELVDMIIERDGERMLTICSVKPVTREGTAGEYTCTADIADEQLIVDRLKECCIRMNSVHGEARSSVPEQGDTLSLYTPEIEVTKTDGASYFCSVVWRDTGVLPAGFELSDGSIVRDRDFTIPYTEDKELSICARYDQGEIVRRGPRSQTRGLFPAGYYPVIGEDGTAQIFYRGGTEETVSIPITNDVMGDCSENFEMDRIALKRDGGSYTLTISTKSVLAREDLEAFVGMVKDKVPPYGFYRLRDMILRSAGYQLTDTTYFSCFMEADKRTADLCPGMGLQLTTAVYMPQYNSAAATMSGFAVTSSECYPVVMSKDRQYLEFDRYAGNIADYMSEDSIGSPDTSTVFVSNVTDLLRPSLRQPYYRVLYPGYFMSATNMESPYASDNVVILAADSFQKIQTACEAITENPAAIRNLSIPVILFRGRSNLSLRIRIWMNGEAEFVPVGTTVEDVLQMWNLYDIKRIELFRRDSNGIKRPVFLEFSDASEHIVLLNGDSICF